MISVFIQIVLFTFCFTATGCTLFKKDNDDDMLENITEMVLDKEQGVQIEIKPIKEKK